MGRHVLSSIGYKVDMTTDRVPCFIVAVGQSEWGRQVGYHALSYHWVLVSGDDACKRHLHDISVSSYKQTGFGMY